MATRERRLDRAERLIGRALTGVGDELREARLQAGLAQRDLGHRVGISHSHVSRIERGKVRNVRYGTLVRIGAVLGLDIPLRAYPNGDRVRDAGQLALLARFRTSLPAGLGWRAEVPLGVQGDLRAWDAVITAPGWALPVEAETRLRDVQALLRRLSLKQRDGRAECILLVVADSRHNRQVLRLAAAEFATAFPTSPRGVARALAAGHPPPSSGLVRI